MRKLVATASLALLLLGCGDGHQNEAVWEGVPTSGWVELTKVSEEEDVAVRRHAVEVLGELGLTEAEQTVPALAEALADPDPHVRLMALKSLEKLAPKAKKAEAAVTRAMSDKNKGIVKQAIKTLKAISKAQPSALNGH